jgi:hypothetical protein
MRNSKKSTVKIAIAKPIARIRNSKQPVTEKMLVETEKSDFWKFGTTAYIGNEPKHLKIKGIMASDVFPEIRSGVGVEIFFEIVRFSDGRDDIHKQVRTAWTIGGNKSSRAKAEENMEIHLKGSK